jgi:high-affinity iron transporter
MTFSFLVMAREGIEMALIITILLGYLRTTGEKRHFRSIWAGVVAASVLSLAFAAGLKLVSRELDGRALEAFEGFTMLFAVGVLTWMLFWMRRRQPGSQRPPGEADRALSGGSVMALSLLAFTSVGRKAWRRRFLFGSTRGDSDLMFVVGGLGVWFAAAVGVRPLRGGANSVTFTVSGRADDHRGGLLTNAMRERSDDHRTLGPPWNGERLP